MFPVRKKDMHLSVKPEGYFSKTRSEMIRFVPKTAAKILDIGCGSGEFAQKIKHSLDAELWGVEIESVAAQLAKTKIDKVLTGDIFSLKHELPNGYFDCIVLNDVLEHFVDPFSFLSDIQVKLSKTGVIVCSIPNVRYLLNLFNLLIRKNWDYEDEGILDRTHLRFFTRKSIVRMFHDLGYEILQLRGINGLTSWKFNLINILFLGHLSDTRYLQFACVVKPA